MAVNAAELLSRIRQRKRELQTWHWWDTKVGTKVYYPPPKEDHYEEPVVELYLTPSERKRQKKLDKYAKQEDRSQRIKLGLELPPEAKLKVSNAPAVFGAAFVRDPTKYEALAKEAEDDRRTKHLADNAARKLTPGERWEKSQEKLLSERNQKLYCVAFRTPKLDSKSQYIVDYTAKKFMLTGSLLLGPDDAFLVLEGGYSSIAKCEKLLVGKYSSMLLWKGSLLKANFTRWSIHTLPNRLEFLKVYGVDSIFKS